MAKETEFMVLLREALNTDNLTEREAIFDKIGDLEMKRLQKETQRS